MLLDCRNCSAQLESLAIDRYDGHGTCPSCGHLNDFSALLQVRELSPEHIEAKRSAKLPGSGEELPNGAVIHWRKVIFADELAKKLLTISIVLAFFSVFFWAPFTMARKMPVVVAIVIGLPFAMVPVLFWYFVLAGFFNKTIIRMDRETLIVRYRPFWFPGQINVPKKDLVQIYSDGTGSIGPILRVKSKNFDRHVLPSVGDLAVVLGFESWLEKKFGLRDNTLVVDRIADTSVPSQIIKQAAYCCQACAAVIPSDSIDSDTGKATCGSCGQVSSFAKESGISAPQHLTDSALLKDIHLSHNQKVWFDGPTMVIEQKPARGASIVLLPFGLGFTGAGLVAPIGAGISQGLFLAVVLLIFISPFTLIGYWMVTRFTNTITLRVDRTEITKFSKPLPVGRKFRMLTKEIVDIEAVEAGRDYQVFLIGQNGQRRCIAPNVDSKESAMGIVGLLKKKLGIQV